MIENIIAAANSVGINAFITNSEERLESQLNRITREEELPIMLVSWDIDVTMSFDLNGFLENPQASVVALLLTKAEDTSRTEALSSADKMALLFQNFIQELNKQQVKYQKQSVPPIDSAGYKMVPLHGAGKHSGILGRWTMRIAITNC